MITLDSMELPADLLWNDEFDWVAASAVATRTLQGKQVVQATAIPSQSGRVITLGNEDAWIDRDDLLVLQQWAGIPGKELLLALHDERAYQVVFRHWDKPTIQAAPVAPLADPDGQTRYRLQALKLAIV